MDETNNENDMSILDILHGMHSPNVDEGLKCDVCGNVFDSEEAEFGFTVIGLKHGVFWLCHRCTTDAVIDKLEAMDIWKEPENGRDE